MRYLYVTLIVLATAIVLLFKFQNLQSVTVKFLNVSVTMPLSWLAIIVYILGMLTGGFVLAALRSWVRGARRKPE